jgi:hypothetical protein
VEFETPHTHHQHHHQQQHRALLAIFMRGEEKLAQLKQNSQLRPAPSSSMLGG